MFREYSGEDVDWFQLAFYFEEQERKRRERNRFPTHVWRKLNPDKKAAALQRWRANHPDIAREQWKRSSATYRKRKPDTECRKCTADRAAGKSLCTKHLEAARLWIAAKRAP